jgi:glycosyltransferase involved in cell wall biosynthesis
MNSSQESRWLSIVIPVKNEQKNIGVLLNQIDKALKNIDSYEIVVINHSSTDNTLHILKDFSAKHKTLRILTIQDNNIKLGEAIQAGINFAYGKYIITMDGDLSHPVYYLPKFISYFQQGYDFILGGRYQKHQPAFYPIQRYYISKIFNTIPRIYLQNGMSDFTTGFRGFRKLFFEKLTFKSQDFNFHLELNIKLSRYIKNRKEIPIQYIKREEGTSKLRYRQQFLGYVKAILFGVFT